jgi:cobalt-zinc-cadmium efflux system protein
VSLVLLLNAAMIVGLVVAGFASNSLGLLSEGGDFLADSLALGLGLLAIHLRDHHRNEKATTWVGMINGAWLLLLSVGVGATAIGRLVSGTPEVHGLPVLIASAVAAVVMLAAALILGTGSGREDLHMRSILLDTIADGAAAAVVAVVGGVIAFTRSLYWLDSVAAGVVSILIAIAAVRLLVDVAKALRTGTVYSPADDD